MKKVMNEKEFNIYYQKMVERINEGKQIGWDRNERRYALICCLGAETECAFTGEQIKRLFDMCFNE